MNQLLTWTKTTKGKDMLYYDGFLYQYCKTYANGELYYKCEQNRTNKKCTVTLNLNNSKDAIRKAPAGPHTHPPPSKYVPTVKRLRDNIKVRVKAEPRAKAQSILLEEVGKSLREDGLVINTDTVQIIPTYKQLHHTLWNIRHKDTPNLPESTDDINLLNDKYNLTNEGKRYKLYDSLDNHRMVIYSSNIGLEILSKSLEWHADGTFKCAPRKYKQMYLIHAWYKGHMYLCAKVFLKNKDEATYTRMLRMLVENAEDCRFKLHPEKVTVDFEQAAINSFKTVFDCEVKGCFFHYEQCIWRNVVDCGLRKVYEENITVKGNFF